MTRAELFLAFPRPWRLDEEEVGGILCADGQTVLQVDAAGEHPDEDASALAELIGELVNGAEE